MVVVRCVTVIAVRQRLLALLHTLRRYIRSPKGYLTVALVVLACIAAPGSGLAAAATMLLWGVAGATVMELLLVRHDEGRWRFPSSAVLTGMLAGMILCMHKSSGQQKEV